MKALPSVYINKVQKHNKFFYYELPDGQIIAKYNYDELLMNIEKLGFDKMELKAPVDEAADVVMTDKGHLDPNPIPISKEDIIKCLNAINDGNL